MLAVNIRGYLVSCGEDAMVARLDALVADLAAVSRENAELLEQAREDYRRINRLKSENATLREALEGLDGPLAWIVEHYPKAMREMPSEHFAAIREAGRALAASPAAEDPQP